MGCSSSDTAHSYFSAKSPIRPCLEEPQKVELRKLIEQDNVVEFAIKVARQNISLNAEISDPGIRWMMIHLCCRHEADNILEYILKHYFVEHGSLYIDFVNAPTIEGYTPLHLCAMWKAEKCFIVLNYYGGLGLTSRDKYNKTPLEVASQYNCKKIVQTLSSYRMLSISFTMLQSQRLISGNIIAEDPASQKKRNDMNKISENNKIPIAESEQMKKLKQDKKLLQDQLASIKQQKVNKEKELQKQKLELQANKDSKVKQKIQEQKQTQAKIQEALKLEREKFKNQMQEKQNQIIKAKEELRKAEERKAQEERLKAQKLADQFAKQKAEQIQNMNNSKNQALDKLKQKQKIKPNNDPPVKPPTNDQNKQKPNPSTTTALSQKFKSLKQPVPPQIEKAYAKALQKGSFIDETFPPQQKSIGNKQNENFANFKSTIVWLRPKDIFGGEQFKLFDGIDPSDVQQGELGVCYMLATISSLAETPKYIQKMFVFYDINLGFYVIKLFINGKPKFMVIDDYIPCDKNTNFPIFTQPVGNELWVMLIEKCWAKAIGSYLSAEGMVPDEMMEDLTGAPGFGYVFQQQPAQGQQAEPTMTVAEHLNIIVDFAARGSTIVLSSKQEKVEGLVEGHAYSLLECYQYKGDQVFKVRNPWGNFQWQGQYSEKDKKLPKDFKDLVKYNNEDDGVFYLSGSEVISLFSYYSISDLEESHLYSYLQFKSKKEEDKFFKFSLKKDGYTNVRVTQLFQRMVNDKDYQYSPLLLQIGKIENEKSITFIGEGDKDTYNGAKSVHAFETVGEELKAGDYFVRVKPFWNNDKKYNTAVLVVYAAQQVQIQQLDSQKGLNYWKLLLNSHAQLNVDRAETEDQLGFFRVDVMKGQFIFQAEVDKPGEYIAEFEFSQDQLVGTRLQINKANPTKLEIPVNKNMPGVGVVTIVDPRQGGQTGQLSISFRKK